MKNYINFFTKTRNVVLVGGMILLGLFWLIPFIHVQEKEDASNKEKAYLELQRDTHLSYVDNCLLLDDSIVLYKFVPVVGGDMGFYRWNVETNTRGTRTVKEWHHVNSFLIGETPVTRALIEYVCSRREIVKGSLDYYFCRCDTMLKNDEWFTFIESLNKATGLKFRLPTNDEWEYAARGGKKSKNYIFSGSNDIDEVGFCKENANGVISSTFSAKEKQPNELGIYDMSGGVYELTSTRISEISKFFAPFKDSFNYYIQRGGSCEASAQECRIDCEPNQFRPMTGARLVLDY